MVGVVDVAVCRVSSLVTCMSHSLFCVLACFNLLACLAVCHMYLAESVRNGSVTKDTAVGTETYVCHCMEQVQYSGCIFTQYHTARKMHLRAVWGY